MINLKKIVAVALAATMCMGVGITSSASTLPTGPDTDQGSANNGLQLEGFDRLNSPWDVDPAPNNGAIQNTQGVGVSGTNGKGERNDQLTFKADGITKGSASWNSVNSVNEIADILAENGLSVPAGTTIMALGNAVVNGISDEQDNVVTFALPAGVQFTTDPYDTTKYHAGDEIWAMFETGLNTGVWEMRSGTINGNGEVDFKVDHTGAIILLKTMKNGRIVAIEKDEQGNEKPPVVVEPSEDGSVKPVTPSDDKGTSTDKAAGTSTTASLGTSPKTGEF